MENKAILIVFLLPYHSVTSSILKQPLKRLAMNKVLLSAACFFAVICLATPADAKGVHVRGHTSKSGTYTMPHMRTSPDHSRMNNWSTKGNVNPYTGKPGTKNAYRK